MSNCEHMANQPDLSDAQSNASSAMIDAIDCFINSSSPDLIRKASFQSQSKQLKKIANSLKLSRCRTHDTPNFRAAKAREDVGTENIVETGFTTGNNKPIKVNAKSTLQAQKIFDDLRDQPQSLGGGANEGLTLGFKTGNNKEIKIDKKKVAEAEKLFVENNYPEMEESFSVGFSTGGGKAIKINQQQIRKAEKFFEEQKKQEAFGSFGPCGFSTGNSRNIKISNQAMQKAMAILNSPTKQVSQPSKDTKPKLNAAPARDQMNIKTVNMKPRGKTSKKLLIFNKDPKESTSSQKQKQYETHFEQLRTTFVPLKLKDLNDIKTDMSDFKQPESFHHDPLSCSVLFCLLCKQKIEQTCITKNTLYEILSNKHRRLTEQVFDESYSQTVFKLSKYNKYYPQLINKRLEPTNILQDIEKRICLQLYSKKQSALKGYRTGKQYQGAVINVLVKSISYVEERNCYYIELSDGWCSVYAIVKNEFRSPSGKASNSYFVSSLIRQKKIYMGCKIRIAGWRKYPIGNVMAHMGKTDENLCAIEIFFNGIMPLASNAKLGFQKQPFFRPISKCKCNGGTIQLAQLLVLRKLVSSNESYFYMRVADDQANSYIVKMPGGEDLTTYYRPKQTYHIRKLRFIDQGFLELTRQSSIDEIKNFQARITYQQALKKLLILDETSVKCKVCDILLKSVLKLDSSANTVTGETAQGKTVTLKGQIICREIKKYSEFLPLLVEQIQLEQPSQLIFKQTQFTRIRKDTKQQFYKGIIASLK